MPFVNKKEGLGAALALLSAALWGAFPLLVHQGVQSIPPLTFAALSTLIAVAGAFIYAIVQGSLKELKERSNYSSLAAITLFVVVIQYSVYFIGAKFTSGVNASFLLLSEIIFTV